MANGPASPPGLHQGCLRLIVQLYNHSDYSLWLFSSSHLWLSNFLRPLIKHGDADKVSKVLRRHFCKLKKAQSEPIVTMFPHAVP